MRSNSGFMRIIWKERYRGASGELEHSLPQAGGTFLVFLYTLRGIYVPITTENYE